MRLASVVALMPLLLSPVWANQSIPDGICQTTSHVTGNHFDLNPLVKTLPEDKTDWHVRGFDFGTNFTVNICAPLLEKQKSYQGVEMASNVSASYIDPQTKKPISLGSVSSAPYTRGRNLLLEYKDGSVCTGPNGEPTPYRMSSVLTFKCDNDGHKRAIISYVANSDNCSFFFEVRTPYACPAVNESESLSPFLIFLIISFVAFMVYFVGAAMFSPRSRGISLGGIRLTKPVKDWDRSKDFV